MHRIQQSNGDCCCHPFVVSIIILPLVTLIDTYLPLIGRKAAHLAEVLSLGNNAKE